MWKKQFPCPRQVAPAILNMSPSPPPPQSAFLDGEARSSHSGLMTFLSCPLRTPARSGQAPPASQRPWGVQPTAVPHCPRAWHPGRR